MHLICLGIRFWRSKWRFKCLKKGQTNINIDCGDNRTETTISEWAFFENRQLEHQSFKTNFINKMKSEFIVALSYVNWLTCNAKWPQLNMIHFKLSPNCLLDFHEWLNSKHRYTCPVPCGQPFITIYYENIAVLSLALVPCLQFIFKIVCINLKRKIPQELIHLGPLCNISPSFDQYQVLSFDKCLDW